MQDLLRAGADINAREQYLFPDKSNSDALRKATYPNQPEGRTILMLAALNGDEAIVKTLLKNGADVNARADVGETALIEAAAENRHRVVSLLLSRGAKIDTQDLYGRTALMEAANDNGFETVQCLLNNGASVDKKDKQGFTAMMFATKYGDNRILKALLAKHTDVNVAQEKGYTVLMHAILPDANPETIRLLIRRGAAVNRKAIDGMTALQLAKYVGDPRIIRLLKDAGAKD